MDVPGAAKLSYCSCCRFGTWQGNSCLSRELQTWATAVGCSSGTLDGSSCVVGAAKLATAVGCSFSTVEGKFLLVRGAANLVYCSGL